MDRFSCNVDVVSLSNRSPILSRISVGSRLSIVGNDEFVQVDLGFPSMRTRRIGCQNWRLTCGVRDV